MSQIRVGEQRVVKVFGQVRVDRELGEHEVAVGGDGLAGISEVLVRVVRFKGGD